MTAPLILGTLNLIVIDTVGEECGITEKEAQYLVPSLQRTLERMPKGAAERLAVVIDPAIIIAVCGIWLRRIGQTKRQQALQQYVVGPQERARANGVSGSEYRVAPEQPQNASGAVYADMQPPAQSTWQDVEVPMPEHPDFTANAVPSTIRDSFDSTF